MIWPETSTHYSEASTNTIIEAKMGADIQIPRFFSSEIYDD